MTGTIFGGGLLPPGWADNHIYLAGMPAERQPRIVLWSWERPDDLSFIDSEKYAVAYYAATIRLDKTRMLPRPRLNPLRVPASIYAFPVFRLENRDPAGAAPVATVARSIIDYILQYASQHHSNEVQIDFDARPSEREFYAGLLRDLRQLAAGKFAVSITTLASWCLYDQWIRDDAADEAVAMLFSMGIGKTEVLRCLRQHKPLLACRSIRQSAGICIDEPSTNESLIGSHDALSNAHRVYIFSAKPWNRPRFELARTLAENASSKGNLF